jgi:hypothetical protein
MHPIQLIRRFAAALAGLAAALVAFSATPAFRRGAAAWPRPRPRRSIW